MDVFCFCVGVFEDSMGCVNLVRGLDWCLDWGFGYGVTSMVLVWLGVCWLVCVGVVIFYWCLICERLVETRLFGA